MREHSYFGVMHRENSEVQIAVFSKWNMLQEWKKSRIIYLVIVLSYRTSYPENIAQFFIFYGTLSDSL